MASASKPSSLLCIACLIDGRDTEAVTIYYGKALCRGHAIQDHEDQVFWVREEVPSGSPDAGH